MEKLIKRIERHERESKELYEIGVLNTTSSMGIQVSDELLAKLIPYGEVKVVDFDKNSCYPIRLEVRIGNNTYFSVMTLDEYMELSMSE